MFPVSFPNILKTLPFPSKICWAQLDKVGKIF